MIKLIYYSLFSIQKEDKRMSYKKHTKEFKEKVAKAYLGGARPSDLAAKYEINNTQIFRWTQKWKEKGSFEDRRGKRGKRKKPLVTKIDKKEMTKDEYIAYLEMELGILKYIAFLERKSQK